MGVTEYGTFAEVRARLDEILVEVRKKDLSLEKSLDLYEEAIKLGNRCAELVDKPDFSEEEAAEALAAIEGAAGAGEGRGDADGADARDEAPAGEDAAGEDEDASRAGEGANAAGGNAPGDAAGADDAGA